MDTSGLKTIGIAILVIILLFGLFFGAAYWKYRLVLRDPPPVTMTQAPRFVTIGDDLQELNATFDVPWDKEPDAVAFVWTEGVTPVTEPLVLFDSYGWGADKWTVRAVVAPVKECIKSAGVMFVSFSGKTYMLRLPPLHRIGEGELSTVPEKNWTAYVLPVIGFIGGLLILVLVIATIRDFWKKRPA